MVPRARKLTKSVHSDAQRAFCDAMIAARRKAGLTQYELADRLKKPQSSVAKYEGGERRVDVVEFIQICRMLDTDPKAPSIANLNGAIAGWGIPRFGCGDSHHIVCARAL